MDEMLRARVRFYYAQTRAYGGGVFRAVDCLRLAREVARADFEAARGTVVRWHEVRRETWPDGSTYDLPVAVRIF